MLELWSGARACLERRASGRTGVLRADPGRDQWVALSARTVVRWRKRDETAAARELRLTVSNVIENRRLWW